MGSVYAYRFMSKPGVTVEAVVVQRGPAMGPMCSTWVTSFPYAPVWSSGQLCMLHQWGQVNSRH